MEECSFPDSTKDEEFVEAEDYVSKMMMGSKSWGMMMEVDFSLVYGIFRVWTYELRYFVISYSSL